MGVKMMLPDELVLTMMMLVELTQMVLVELMKMVEVGEERESR
jgi:hypothetical protein